MPVLVIAEHDNQKLKPATFNAISAAMQLGEVEVLVAGFQCAAVAKMAAQIQGVGRVLHADAKPYEHFLAENFAQLVVTLANQYTHVLAPATTLGKNILPRVAALLDVAMISDVIQIVAQDTFVRPIYAGNAFTHIQSLDVIKVLSVRATAFSPAIHCDELCVVSIVDTVIENTQAQFISHTLTVLSRPELSSARIVISGGRGLQSGENFQLLEKIADRLGAAVGASRAAVDAGFVPNDYQVGQTGKVVAPDLYFAVGISGAIQHLAGMKDSKVIVAINKDPDAPIFQVADYGLVGDLFPILLEVDAELEKRGFVLHRSMEE